MGRGYIVEGALHLSTVAQQTVSRYQRGGQELSQKAKKELNKIFKKIRNNQD